MALPRIPGFNPDPRDPFKVVKKEEEEEKDDGGSSGSSNSSWSPQVDPFKSSNPFAKDDDDDPFSGSSGGSSGDSKKKDRSIVERLKSSNRGDSYKTKNEGNSGSSSKKKKDTSSKKKKNTNAATNSELQERWNALRGDDSLSAHLERFDLATRRGMDALLDNPNASLQDNVRETAEWATGSDDAAKDAQNLATQYSQTTSSWFEGTPVDNEVTGGAVWLADRLVADPGKALLRGTTGIDVDTGSSEGNVGAVDAFDLGVTLGTAGLGGAATTAARTAAKSDEAAGLFARATGRGTDDALAGGNRVTETQANNWGRGPENLDLAGQIKRSVDEYSARIGTEASPSTTSARTIAERLGIRTSDDAFTVSRKTATDVAEDAAAGGRYARTSDELTQMADESGTIWNRVRNSVPTASGPVTYGVTGALATGALLSVHNRSTDTDDSGGDGDSGGSGSEGGGANAPWDKPELIAETNGGCLIYSQSRTDGSNTRYLTIWTAADGTLYALERDGTAYRFDATTAEESLPSVSSKRAAEKACAAFNEAQEDGDEDEEASTEWGDMKAVEVNWRAKWMLLFRTRGMESQYFAVRLTDNDRLEALTSAGQPRVGDTWDSIPSHGDEESAREAYQTWADANPGEKDDSPTEGWGKWSKVRTSNGWTILSRTSTDGERTQFVIGAENMDGESIYLHPNGSVKVGDPHIYATASAIQSALSAFADRQAKGEVEDGETPDGSPDTADVENDTKTKKKGLGALFSNKWVLGGAAAVGGAYILRSES